MTCGEWVIDILQEWVLDQGYLTTGFIDRGDPANYDFTIGHFTVDSAWHDLDLSSIVPAGAKAVLFAYYLRAPTINRDFMLRKKGNVNAYNIFFNRILIANLAHVGDCVCPCDENRKIQYNASVPGYNRIRLTVKGWWL